MKSLILLRHAEAVAMVNTTDDSQRALSARGQAQAHALGEKLHADGWVAQRILCSTALRAQQTAQGLCAAAGWKTKVTLRPHLYNADPVSMMELLRDEAASVERMLVVAHAPGIAELASALTTRRGGLSLVCEPATLIEIVIDIRGWTELMPGCASMRRIWTS
jgi:phosphohistidine phosphatase